MSVEEKTIVELCNVMGLSETTIRKYIKEPHNAPLGAVLKLSKSVGVEIEELRSRIQY